jgi:hypothetical protein
LPAAYQLHSRRRPAWGSVGFLLLLIIGGTLALKVGNAGSDAPTTTDSDEVLSGTDTSQAANIATTRERSRPLEGRHTDCERDPWSSIDGRCNVVKVRKHLAMRATSRTAKISSVPLGHSTRPVADTSAAVVEPDDSRAPTTAPTVAISNSADHPISASRKGRKSPRSGDSGRNLVRHWDWRDDPWSARAYVPPDKRQSGAGYRPEWSWSWGRRPFHPQ